MKIFLAGNGETKATRGVNIILLGVYNRMISYYDRNRYGNEMIKILKKINGKAF